MRRHWQLALVLALAACSKQQAASGPTAQGGAAGCPSGAGVFVASYVSQDPATGRSGWVVPLHAAPVGSTAAPPAYASVDPATAASVGVPSPPAGTLWLATARGEPCRATAGGLYSARIDAQGAGQASVSYGFELEGCPAPANPEEAGGIVLVSDQSPSGCRFEPPQPIAARLGETAAGNQWQRPTRETPLPSALAAAIPAKDCSAPACEKLWAFGEVKVDGRTVAWSGAVNWLSVGNPAQQCSWPADRFSGIFVPGPDGNAVKVTEGQTNPLVLSAVLADATGAKVLLAEGPGEYATYDLGGESPRLARAVKWMVAPPEAWQAVDHIGPICDGH